MEGRGAAVVGGCEEDSLGQTDAMKTRLQSLRTKLRNEGEHGRGTPILRARARYAKKHTLHVFAKRSGVRHWDLSDRNADSKEIERVAIDAVGAMKSGETVIWDRLGRSGRVACRASSCLRRAMYFNPLELLFNDLKQHDILPNFPKNGRPLSKSKIAGLFCSRVCR